MTDDPKWRDQVNDRLASHTASEVVQNDRLDASDEKLERVLTLLEGVAEDRNDNGLKGDIKELIIAVNRLNSVLSLDITGNPGFDRTGNPGYLKKIDALWNKHDVEIRSQGYRWKFWTAVAGLVAAILTALITNLDKIEKLWTKKDQDPLHQMMEKVKHPKPRQRHYPLREPTENIRQSNQDPSE